MKKLLGYLPFHFLCCLVIGIILQYSTSLWYGSIQNILFIFGFHFIILILLINRKGFEFILYSFFVWIGIGLIFIQDDRNYENYFENFLSENTLKRIVVTKVLKPGNFYHKYEAKVVNVDRVITRGFILVNVKKDSITKPFEVGEYLLTNARFRELIPPLNPHQFNYKSYLSKQGIHRQVFLDSDQFIQENRYNFSLIRLAFTVRAKIQKSLQKSGFQNDEYAVINALLLGQRQDISSELIEDYSKAGAIHILAVSGLHVGIVLLILNFLFSFLNTTQKSKVIKVLIVVFFLWIFAFIAGLSASVVRAVTMFSAVAIGQLFNRKNSVFHSLIISMFLLLLVKPLFLFDVGFQLSYLAVFGIVIIQPQLYRMWRPRWKLIDYYWQLLTVSFAAQLGILPLSLFYFHQFPGLFIVSNLVIIPFLGAILGGGILVIFLSLFNIIPDFVAQIYNHLISLLNEFIHWISFQESWLLTQISFSEWMVFSSYAMIVFGIRFLQKMRPRSLQFFLISILIFQMVLFIEKWMINSKNQFIVFHKSRYTVVGERKANRIEIYHNLEPERVHTEKLIESYQVGEEVEVKLIDTIPNYFELKNQSILLIDNKGVFSHIDNDSLTVVLINSPKINLERMMQKLRPIRVIADGSNYKNFITQWEQTCVKTKTPFWYTGQKGAYILK